MERSKILLLVLFLLLVGVQIYVPAKMVGFNEDIVQNGTRILLEVAPIDPYDPFRGKYITLNFKEDEVMLRGEKDWVSNSKGYLELSRDTLGFWVPYNLHKTKDQLDGKDYIEVEINYAYEDYVGFEFPFNRFYMDESKALAAENLYFESLADTTKKTYAVVYIQDGEAVLQDVQINGESIADLVGETTE